MSERTGFTVFVVDDDASIRDALGLQLGLRGYRTSTFAVAEDFLAALRPDSTGCVLVDLRMPGMGGLELQRELRRRGCELPVVIITGHGDIAAAREAFKADAVDFLEKPFDEEGPIIAIEVAYAREEARLARHDAVASRHEALAALTPREREVAGLLVLGLHNREVGERLGISARTVEVHKARVMQKLGARGLADLIRIASGSRPA